MSIEDEFPVEASETGSDDLLADDNLRLPDSANTLVRLHAIRAWLTRRQKETNIEIGEAALALQEEPQETRLRRREQQALAERSQYKQQALTYAQQRLHAYEEAEALLEECVSHVTSGERVLVEYYLTLEELVENAITDDDAGRSSWLQAIKDVQHRIEHVGSPNEE